MCFSRKKNTQVSLFVNQRKGHVHKLIKKDTCIFKECGLFEEGCQGCTSRSMPTKYSEESRNSFSSSRIELQF